MRIAVARPRHTNWPKFDWVAKAAEALGHSVRRFGSKDNLAEVDAESDVLLFSHKGSGIGAPNITAVSEHNAVWVTWQFDLMALGKNVPLAESPAFNKWTSQNKWEPTDNLRCLRAMDCVGVKERGLLKEYAALGVNAFYADQGCPSNMPRCEHREIPEWDVLLFGCSGDDRRQRRQDVSSLLAEGFTVAWAGHVGEGIPSGVLPLPFCPALELPKLASRAAVVLGVDFRHDLEGYWSDRVWLALGMGACHVRRHTDGMTGLPMATYRTTGELIKHVSELRTDRRRRETTGHLARSIVMDHHTYESHLEELLCKLPTKQPVPLVTEAV